MRVTDTSDLWWKTAVVYCLDVETFLDWDDDGVGDFAGLAHRLDYLAELGVTCLWLMPFYPTPDRDDGYDVTDFYAVDPRLGHLGDLVEAVRTARDRGMRVIADLVLNHTSDQHPWFLDARSSKDSPYRDFYVWHPDPPDKDRQTVFPGEEATAWEYDEKTGEYYLHNFYSHQPDLNLANPVVREEIAKIMGFWMQLGLSGFRVDAVPFLLESFPGGDGKEAHAYLREVRSFLNRRSGEGVLLGEVNLPYEEQERYFGGVEGDELTMQFDFVGMQRLYLSLARSDATPLAETLAARPHPARDSQWANFVRNHDELTLDKLSDDERQEVFDAFGPEERMQVYGRGLVRRLPPMLGGDPRRIRMVYSLLFSLPGTPVLFYGEEIGMGENLDVGGRGAVRTPMQWSDSPAGGFSRAPSEELSVPVTEGPFGSEHVNAMRQRHDPDSLFNFMKLLIARYRASNEIGWSEVRLLETEERDIAVFAHELRAEEGRMVAFHNFSPEPRRVRARIADVDGSFVFADLLREGESRVDDAGLLDVELDGYGYRWLRVLEPGTKRLR
ncbi:alpha-amylase family protein [Desertivibrio insolitus]|uniref:alpha-amylase family protein n=1 Tax=Herbiconiux sp. SYSU D00978 TaxID=2812562 RepID=UPI001A96C527|nr:alpha-amylase family protein [Herbiconiux sp. SYSU D00978]